MAELRLNNVSKLFDRNIWAVRDITFVIRDREFCVLLGPSGCGKTTILRLIAGLEEPTAGEILIDQTIVNQTPPDQRDIAMVFQNYALYPHLTVFDNLAFGLRMRRNPKPDIEQRVRAAAQTLDIEKLLGRKPRQLSGGERQRVALGRALVRQPKIFLFDEPLSNLDAKLRVSMRAELARLRERIQATVVYVTHDQVEAMTLGDTIIVMKEGLIQQISDPESLYRKPVNRFVAGFIGSPAMNFIPGVIARVSDGVVFRGRDVELALNRDRARYADREIVLGIRPADFTTAGASVAITVDAVEPLGAERYVSGRLGNHPVQARLPEGMNARRGETLQLAVNPNTIYLFDGKTDTALY